jgi:hypothetical protein
MKKYIGIKVHNEKELKEVWDIVTRLYKSIFPYDLFTEKLSCYGSIYLNISIDHICGKDSWRVLTLTSGDSVVWQFENAIDATHLERK